VRALVVAFYRRRNDLVAGNVCPCEACGHVAELDLKVIVHRGDVVKYRLHGLEDLGGFAVIEAHRLLKNGLGRTRYVLVSEAASPGLSLPWESLPAAHAERYDDIGEIRCDVYPLDEVLDTISDAKVSRLRDFAGKLARNVHPVG